VKTYVDWAAKQGFSVIDVNLPKHITDDESALQGHESADRTESRTEEATQLLTYLWDNYIELNDATHVFLMGTNTGHGAIINFIKANEQRAQETLTKTISFVEDVSLQSCKSSTNDALAGWYYQSSMVFVSARHNFWYSEYARKIKKRFGHVFKSFEEDISGMLAAHKDIVLEMLLEQTEDWRNNRPTTDDEEMAEANAPDQTRGRSNLPPIGNFALTSPARNLNLGTQVASASLPRASPNGRRVGSPTKTANADFAVSPSKRTARSPAR